jgi:hypothetical protein
MAKTSGAVLFHFSECLRADAESESLRMTFAVMMAVVDA